MFIEEDWDLLTDILDEVTSCESFNMSFDQADRFPLLQEEQEMAIGV